MKFLQLIKKGATAPTPEEGVLYYDENTESISLKKGGEPVPPTPTVELVDLGLPSGLKWATCNIGATSPEEYGKYFQWGATVGYEGDEAKAHSTWETAPFNDGSIYYQETYFIANSGTWLTNDAILKSEYDAATANLGEGYRMPTRADMNELRANTTTAWTQVNGVICLKFTSKSDTSKSIVFPATGNCHDGSFDDVGYEVHVWTSSFYSDYPAFAWFLYSYEDDAVVVSDHRYYGLSVRAVHE